MLARAAATAREPTTLNYKREGKDIYFEFKVDLILIAAFTVLCIHTSEYLGEKSRKKNEAIE